jgi:hypothetical protein
VKHDIHEGRIVVGFVRETKDIQVAVIGVMITRVILMNRVAGPLLIMPMSDPWLMIPNNIHVHEGRNFSSARPILTCLIRKV